MVETLTRAFAILLTTSLLAINGYTPRDVDLLAQIMYLENGSTGKTEDENRQILIMTGQVVINRAKSGQWGGKTIEAVLYSPGQYAWETKKRIDKVEVPGYIQDLARNLLIYGSNIPSYVVYQSTQKNLGYLWTVRAGECFACAEKGHLYEGDDWVAEILSFDNSYSWFNTHVCRSACERAVVGATMGVIWWNVYLGFSNALGMVSNKGGNLFLP